jgi:hypothetical protein
LALTLVIGFSVHICRMAAALTRFFFFMIKPLPF